MRSSRRRSARVGRLPRCRRRPSRRAPSLPGTGPAAPAAVPGTSVDNATCQAFGGVSVEQPSTTAAVRATAGWILTYRGAPAVTMYSASSGGWTVASGAAYLSAHADDWDGWAANPQHSWSATLPAADVQRAFPAVGRLLRVRVTARNGGGQWGGRIKTVVLEGLDAKGAPTSVTTTGAAIYNLRPWPTYSDGLRSSWWNIR